MASYNNQDYHWYVEDHEPPTYTITSGGTTASGGEEQWTYSLGTGTWGMTGPFFTSSTPNGYIPKAVSFARDPAQPDELIKIIRHNYATNEITVVRGAGSSSPVAHAPNFTLQMVNPPDWERFAVEDMLQHYSGTFENQYTTSTTFVDADGLSHIPIRLGGIYEFEFFLAIKADPAADIQTRWDVPTGVGGTKFVMGPTSVAGGFTGQGQHDARMSGHALTTAIPYQTYTSVNDNHVTERAIVHWSEDHGQNGGWLSLQFAALTSGGTNTGIGKGSYVRWRRLWFTDLSF